MKPLCSRLALFILSVHIVILTARADAELTGKRVGIDPGHGGTCSDCNHAVNTTFDLYEKNVNLSTAIALNKYLCMNGALPFLTRSTDIELTIPERVAVYLSKAVNIGISIHHDGGPPSTNCTKDFVYCTKCSGSAANLAEKVVSRIGDVTGLPLGPVAASDDFKCKKPGWSCGIDGVGQANMGMVSMPEGKGIPAILVEVSFLTNDKEAMCLQDPAYIDKNGWAIYAGIADYFGSTPGPVVGPHVSPICDEAEPLPIPLPPHGLIAGRVFNDHNGNRKYELDEELLKNWHVQLYKGGVTVATAITDANGQYSFKGLEAGDYTVNIPVVPMGYILTAPADPMGQGMQPVTLAADEKKPKVDFGVNGPAGVWRASGSIAECSDPSTGGKLWYETDFDDGGWTQITPPDAGWGCNGCSRSYRYDFIIGSPSDLDSAKVYFVSDDGSRLYVNGQHVQDYNGCNLCCVNIPAPTCYCGIDLLPAVRIDHLLQPGRNVVSIQVTDVNGRGFFYGAVRLYPKANPPIACSGPQLLADDFNDGNDVGWTFRNDGPPGDHIAGNWTVHDGVYDAQQNTNPSAASTRWAGSPSWTDYCLELDFNVVSHQAAVLLRYSSWDAAYNIILVPIEHRVTLQDRGASYNYSFPLEYNRWYHLKATVVGQTLECWIDGSQVFSRNLTSLPMLTSGPIGLGVDATPGYPAPRALWDNVRVVNLATSPSCPGNALQFDGVNGEVDVPHESSLSFGPSDAITVEFWFNPSESRNPYHLLGKRIDCSNTNYQIAFGSGELHFSTGPSPEFRVGTSYTPPVGQWTHVAATCDGSTARLYVNGELKACVSGSLGNTNDQPLRFGQSGTCADQNRFAGSMDEVRIWNVARTGPQIAANFNRTVDPNSPGLVGYWNFDESSGEAVDRASLPKNNGTLLNGAQRVVSNAPTCNTTFPPGVFEFTGGPQTYVVPSGTYSISIDARGAEGGGNPPWGVGGKGGRVQTTIAVTPGEILMIYVGGRGSPLCSPNTGGPGGFNGGGTGGIDNVDFNGPAPGGGGASDVRQGGDDLAHRVVVAGGGGGSECCSGPNGGDGGGTTGMTGGTAGSGSGPGGGGTQSAGGAGGGGCDGSGSSGGLGQGGQGGNGNRAGGGGGGGYYGGGGGGGCSFGSGGGGGSSYSAGTNTTHTQGFQTGAGQVIITLASVAGFTPPSGGINEGVAAQESVSITAPTNYPNPFNAGTSIRFSLPERDHVALEVLNVLGQRVRILVDEDLQAGLHDVTWDGRDSHGNVVSSGIYFYRLTTSKQTITKKMMLLK